MVSFRDGPKPRNYLSRREQHRVLFLVLSLGLVLILMCEAAKEKNWRWFADLDKNKGPQGVGFLPGDKENAEMEPAPVVQREPFPGVDEKLLETITDNTRFRNEENSAWFNLLGVLHRADESELRKSSIGRVSWLQLNDQSDEYRGELVTVKGTVRRAHRLDAPKNDEGIEAYYQLWLQPDDNPKQPIVVYCLQPPEAFPTGMELREPARVVGFYFKRWLYKGKEDLQTAPVLLAKTIDWQEKPPLPVTDKKFPDALNSIYVLVAVAALLSLLAILYIMFYTRSRPRDEIPEKMYLNFDVQLNSEEESEQEQEKNE